MKAIFFNKAGSSTDIQFGDIPIENRNLKEGELRISFLAGSLNHLDLWVIRGLPHLKYVFPHIAGADFCWRVIESKSQLFDKDQTVIVYPGHTASEVKPENLAPDYSIRGENSPGLFCEEIIIHEKFVAALPSHLTSEQGAAIPLVYLTAWQMIVERAGLEHLKSGPVLVHGAGSGVSQALIEILLKMGVSDIHVTSRQVEKLNDWQDRGIHGHCSDKNLYNSLKSAVGSGRFSVIFDHVGKDYFEMNIKLLRNAGRFVTCGATSGFDVSLDLRQIFFRQLEIRGSTMGSLKHFNQVLEFVSTNRICPQVSEVVNWSEPKRAYQSLEAGHQNGKIVLKAMQ